MKTAMKAKLSDVCEIIAGQSPPSSTYNTNGTGLPFYQGKADFSDLYPQTRMWCSEPQKIAESNDILISVRAPVGPTNLCRERSCIGRGLSAIRCGGSIDTKYLLFYLRLIENRWQSAYRGSTFSAITQNDIKTLEVPLPPLSEQKRIAAILDQADEIRKKRNQAIDELNILIPTILYDMFGDPAINPKGWEIQNLSTAFSTSRVATKCGPFGSALKRDEYVSEGVPVWTMENIQENTFVEDGCLFITEEKYEELESYTVVKGDIIISRAGTVGKMCVVNTDIPKSIISTNLIKLSLNETKIQPYYFTSLMTYCKGRVGRLTTGEDGSYTFMNTGILKELAIPIPPIDFQTAYVERIEQLRNLKARNKQALDETNTLFNSLVQRAFKGEL